jgi:hypothetical protein
MIRVACVLGLVSLVVLIVFVARLSGATATLFVFVGFPTLALALLLYAVQRWRAGAFHIGQGSGSVG